VAAWFAGDQTMLQAFRAGQDLHTLTAATVLNKPATEVTKAERSSAAGGCLVRMPPIGIGSRPK
jgi:DNA polymerase I-like protein with 3'-5' exonuclease and polymerase domains